MPVKFHPNNPIDALETIIVKEDGSPLRGEIDIYRQLWNDLNQSSVVILHCKSFMTSTPGIDS